ncbi:hypothetical protein Pfo_031611, partial [Paulownia fortunei]
VCPSGPRRRAARAWRSGAGTRARRPGRRSSRRRPASARSARPSRHRTAGGRSGRRQPAVDLVEAPPCPHGRQRGRHGEAVGGRVVHVPVATTGSPCRARESVARTSFLAVSSGSPWSVSSTTTPAVPNRSSSARRASSAADSPPRSRAWRTVPFRQPVRTASARRPAPRARRGRTAAAPSRPGCQVRPCDGRGEPVVAVLPVASSSRCVPSGSGTPFCGSVSRGTARCRTRSSRSGTPRPPPPSGQRRRTRRGPSAPGRAGAGVRPPRPGAPDRWRRRGKLKVECACKLGVRHDRGVVVGGGVGGTYRDRFRDQAGLSPRRRRAHCPAACPTGRVRTATTGSVGCCSPSGLLHVATASAHPGGRRAPVRRGRRRRRCHPPQRRRPPDGVARARSRVAAREPAGPRPSRTVANARSPPTGASPHGTSTTRSPACGPADPRVTTPSCPRAPAPGRGRGAPARRRVRSPRAHARGSTRRRRDRLEHHLDHGRLEPEGPHRRRAASARGRRRRRRRTSAGAPRSVRAGGRARRRCPPGSWSRRVRPRAAVRRSRRPNGGRRTPPGRHGRAVARRTPRPGSSAGPPALRPRAGRDRPPAGAGTPRRHRNRSRTCSSPSAAKSPSVAMPSRRAPSPGPGRRSTPSGRSARNGAEPPTGTMRTRSPGRTGRDRAACSAATGCVRHPGTHTGRTVVGGDPGQRRRGRPLAAVVARRPPGAQGDRPRSQDLDPGDRFLDRTDDGFERAVVECVVVGLDHEFRAARLGLAHAEAPHHPLLPGTGRAGEHHPFATRANGLRAATPRPGARRSPASPGAPEHDRARRRWFRQGTARARASARTAPGPGTPAPAVPLVVPRGEAARARPRGLHDATATGRSTRDSPAPSTAALPTPPGAPVSVPPARATRGAAGRTAPSAAGSSRSALTGRPAPRGRTPSPWHAAPPGTRGRRRCRSTTSRSPAA